MKHLLILVLSIAPTTLRGYGCATTGSIPKPTVVIEVKNPYDLEIEAWDVRTNGAFTGAKITILETGSWAITAEDGRTPSLRTPANAQWIQVIVEWNDRCGFTHSYQRGIFLQHQVLTKERVWVDSTPFR